MKSEHVVGGNGGQGHSFASLCQTCAAVPPQLTFCHKKMIRLHGHDLDTESQVEFLEGGPGEFESANEFYAAAIKLLWERWDSVERAENYIANAEKRGRPPEELKAASQEYLSITPLGGVPKIEAPDECYSFRDDWNIREFVWREGKIWRMISWETSA